jgi:uncharacterized membrane protein YdfJ with MMPL/SSD domain
MASGPGSSTPSRSPREHPLAFLGRQIAHHPWRSLVLWVVILVVCLVPAASVGSVINNNFSNPLPNSDESIQAQNVFNAQFPNASSSPSSAIVLLEYPGITGPVGKNATLALTAALTSDRSLHNVSSIDSLYSTYSGYLVGQVELVWSFLGPALDASPSLTDEVNTTATEVWEPVAAYLQQWETIVANETGGTSKSAADWPAFVATRPLFAANATESAVLADFYNGTGGSTVGFNASIVAGCLSSAQVTVCADAALRSALLPVLPTLFVGPDPLLRAEATVGDLDVGNWSDPAAQRSVGAVQVGATAGIAPGWVLESWDAFPSGAPSRAAVASWASTAIAANPIDRWPLPIPSAIYSGFVDPTASATLVIVSFSAPDTYLENGSSVTYADVGEIQHQVASVLGSDPAFGPVVAFVTGSAPLDDSTNTLATSSLSLLLLLTILVLLVIMLIYFRSPSAPALAFGMIGIALVVSLAGIFVVGKLVTTFVAEIESIILVFLMSIGTDYSVFLLARYREELVRGTDPKKAVETTVRWAGQSIVTSGLAVEVVAAALTLSGISFLTQLGICLLIAVACALVVNLMVLPSILVLVGPRIFWPNSGARFARYAERRTHAIETHRDSIARAGRAATRHPFAVILVILLISVPVVVVAVQVPVSYDITNIGLPSSNSAQQGFVHLQNDFGASYSSTSFVLATFASPVVSRGVPNASEFRTIDGLADTMNSTPGVSGVTTLIGSGGAPLDTWLNLSYLPPAARMQLNESLANWVGADGRTVQFTVATNASGFSASAISVLDTLKGRVGAYDATHPGVTTVYYGGAAPTTQDIRTLVNTATEEMLIGAAIGLFVIMLVLLGSAFVPLLALGVIGLSILWSWAGTYFVVGILENEALIFLLPLILLILVMGLGMDYNVLLLTRVKEERILGNRGVEAIRDAVTHAGGVITAAAVILGGAFLLLGFTSPLGLLAAIGLGIGFAVLLQAFVVQLFFTPAVLTLGKDAIWRGGRRAR